MNLRNFSSVKDRREALEKTTGVILDHSGSFTLDEQIASSRNCENMIGVTQVPLGVTGPLLIQNLKGQSREYYIPLATTEGALVASVNRGCKAITESGGAKVGCHRVGTTRGPVFKVNSLAENTALYGFLENHLSEMQQMAEQTSQHLKLKSVTSQGVGKYRYVRFVYDTQDAMGMNMVTIASDAVAKWIEEKTGAVCVSISGNYCVDKKPAWQNIILNRGIKVWAEVTIPKNVLEDVLKVEAQGVYEVWLAKCMLGSAMSGSMAFNAQYANIVAALFLATGQDLGHVGEGSLGITTTEVLPTAQGDSLYMSIYLPDLLVGTVGGGTGLATQQEALSLLGVAGGNVGENALRFAEIVGAAVLAGEISLLSSLAQGTLSAAHERLGRGR